MLKNYIKIAFAVFRRRKFFTFISLFGISFTLMILMIVAAFLNNVINPVYPIVDRSKTLFVNQMKLTNEKNTRTTNAPVAFHFLDQYVKNLKTPALVGIISNPFETNAFVDTRKLELSLSYADENFWEIYQFKFLEGGPFHKGHIDNGDYVAVISEETRKQYFGKENIVGQYIEANNINYRVLGVVRNAPILQIFGASDIYAPYTNSKNDLKKKAFTGSYNGLLLGKSKQDVSEMKAEFDAMVRKIELPKDSGYDLIFTHANTYIETMTRQLLGDEDNSGIANFYLLIFGLMLLFMLLPTINLVNINVSRIMERSSEIGIRKAFGASSGTLVIQFVIENVLLTLIGGIIGLVLAVVILKIVEGSGILPHTQFVLDYKVYFYSLLICLFFGLFSGVYPAFKMSRMHVVNALKGNEL